MLAEIIHESLFHQMAAILILAGLLGFAALKLRQPLIIAFIGVGLLAGPDMLDIVGRDNAGALAMLAELGIALLLFMVGLKLDPGIIRTLGPEAVIAGTLQILLCGLAGTGLCLALGFPGKESLLLGIGLSFSSTIIVVKILSDQRAIDSLYGRMALGILIMQDIAVILAMVVVSTDVSAGGAGGFGLIAVKALAIAGATILFIRFLSQPLSRHLAHNGELMVIFAIGFAGTAAALCSTAGLGKELGGLLAGIALAPTPLNNILTARLTALRDFLLLFFFVNLGAHMSLGNLEQQIAPALILTGFVLAGKPMIIYAIMRLRRYRRRTAFLTGLTLAQISEFSLILVAMGAAAGYADAASADMMTLIALITIGLSTGAILSSGRLYETLEKKRARGKQTDWHVQEDPRRPHDNGPDIIIFGLGRYGTAMAREFRKQNLRLLGIDFDPQAVRNALREGIDSIYGDAADPEFPAHLPLGQAKAVVFAFHHYVSGPLTTDLRRILAASLRAHGYKGHIAATSHSHQHDHDLARQGIDIILLPFEDAAFYAASRITGALNGKA